MSEKVHATFAKASSVRLCAEEGKYKVSSKSGHKGKAPIGLMTFDEDEDPESDLTQSSDGECECVSKRRVLQTARRDMQTEMVVDAVSD